LKEEELKGPATDVELCSSLALRTRAQLATVSAQRAPQQIKNQRHESVVTAPATRAAASGAMFKAIIRRCQRRLLINLIAILAEFLK
jgi:hypothetical protein